MNTPRLVIAHGIDLVEIARIDRMLARHGSRFLERVYRPEEIAYADQTPRRRLERLAARFAAKEAALKALGTGWRSGIAWTDVGIRHDPRGRPALVVEGVAAEIAGERGIRAWDVSLSHVDQLAMASVLALADAAGRPDGHG